MKQLSIQDIKLVSGGFPAIIVAGPVIINRA